MELIPILSLIILVTTISTFIFAVGAYILYKIRERKGKRDAAAEPTMVQAEMVAPVPMMAEQALSRTSARRTFTEERAPTMEQMYDYPGQPMQTRDSGPHMRPTYVQGQQGPNYAEATRYQRERTSDRATRSTESKKFMRYTSDGYEEPKKVEKKKKEDGLRWR